MKPIHATQRVGIYGGTFDPPHLGHLAVAEAAIKELALDHILFVPASAPPHKRGRQITPAEVRLEMLRKAIATLQRASVCDIELRRAGASYTVDTLRTLKESYPRAKLFLILGDDQFNVFETWRESHAIAQMATIAVATRGGIKNTTTPYHPISMQPIELSSTDIRRRIAEGGPYHHMVPEEVRRVIEKKGLYRGREQDLPTGVFESARSMTYT